LKGVTVIAIGKTLVSIIRIPFEVNFPWFWR